MQDERSFSTYAAHIHDETEIVAKVVRGADDAPQYAQVAIGGYVSPVNLTLNVWDRDTLRRLADAAALAYHEWTKAEHEAAGDEAAPKGRQTCFYLSHPADCTCAVAVDAETPADPTGIDCLEAHEGVDA